MINPDEIRSQIQEGQLPDEMRVFRPPPLSLGKVLIFGIIYAILIFFICAGVYILILLKTGNEAIIASSYWPIYSHYPYLVLPQVLLPFLFTYLNWRADKGRRDTALVLLPDGFVQYLPWSDTNTRRPKVIDYRSIKEIALTSS